MSENLDNRIIASNLTVAFYSGTHSEQIATTKDSVLDTYRDFLKRLDSELSEE